MFAARARSPRPRKQAGSGQAMVESLIAILIICLLLFGVFQLAHAFASREILRHAAARAARARTVGFNAWMVSKVMRVASIPDAGEMTVPDQDFADPALAAAANTLSPGAFWDWSVAASPQSLRSGLELARIPEYLASENASRGSQILDYADWDSIEGSGLGGLAAGAAATRTLDVTVRQDYPLDIFVRMLFEWGGAMTPALRDGNLRLRGDYTIENHYPLYLDDQGL